MKKKLRMDRYYFKDMDKLWFESKGSYCRHCDISERFTWGTSKGDNRYLQSNLKVFQKGFNKITLCFDCIDKENGDG